MSPNPQSGPKRRGLTRRRLHALGVASLPGAVGLGCGAGAGGTDRPAGEVVAPPAQIRPGSTITWAVDAGPTRTPLRQDQVTLFKEKFPTIGVQFLEGATGLEKLLSLFAAGSPPDIMRGNSIGLATFASRSQLAPLDGYVKRDKYDLADFFPKAWDSWRFKESQYGVPFLGIRVMYYNRALARQLGLRLPPATWRDPSWTWRAFEDACRSATAREGQTASRWGWAVVRSTDWKPWIWNNGGEIFSADGTKVLIEEAPAVEALQALADLIHRSRVAPTEEEEQRQGGLRGLFNAGNLLFYHEPVASIALNRQQASFDWSLTALPRGQAKSATSYGGGAGWFLATASRVKDETWEFMKVLAGTESVRMEATRGEAPPSRRSVASEPAFASPAEPPGRDMKVVIEALESLHPDTPMVNGAEIDRMLSEQLAPLWLGQKTAKEVAAQIAAGARPHLNPVG